MGNKQSAAKVKFFAISGVIILFLFGGIVMLAIYASKKSEPLTPQQILAKKTWTKDELAEAMTRIGLQRHGTDKKIPKEVYTHLGSQIEKLPEKERDEVVVKSIRGSIEKCLELLRTMTPEQRKNIIEDMLKDASRNREVAESLSGNGKDAIRDKIKDNYNKVVDEAMLNSTTPSERRELAPITKQWLKTVEALQ